MVLLFFGHTHLRGVFFLQMYNIYSIFFLECVSCNCECMCDCMFNKLYSLRELRGNAKFDFDAIGR